MAIYSESSVASSARPVPANVVSQHFVRDKDKTFETLTKCYISILVLNYVQTNHSFL